MEFKTLPQMLTKAITDRTATGVFCVHGNRDQGGDRSHNGALADYAIDGRVRVRHLWNHGGGFFDRGQTPPTAVIKAIRELGREQLPESVLTYAPNATGGVEVEREYLDTPRGNEILAGIKAGAIDEMSYAYDVKESTWVEEEDLITREIFKMTLFDTSDVNWGMNPATVGAKSALTALPFDEHFLLVLATNEDFQERIQDIKRLRETDGRSLNTINIDRVKSLLDQLAPMQAAIEALLTRPDQPKDNTDVMREYLRFQMILAQNNGVPL
jgi:hypothetical protein